MQTFANTGIKTEVIDEIISFAKKHDIHCVAVMEDDERNIIFLHMFNQNLITS